VFKRARWVAIGFGAGVGASVWTWRSVRRSVDRHAPADLVDAGRRVGALGRDVRAAVAEGRDAMHAREAELRARISNGSAAAGP
jgi:hypothetical protein